MTPELAHPRPRPTRTSIAATPRADGATNPTPPRPTAATTHAVDITRPAPRRATNQPPAAVAIMLAALNSASANADRVTERPTGASNVGTQDELITRMPNATNETVHSN